MTDHDDEPKARFPWWLLGLLGVLLSLGSMLLAQQAARQAQINMNNLRIQQQQHQLNNMPRGR
jgi:hypothetical protein